MVLIAIVDPCRKASASAKRAPAFSMPSEMPSTSRAGVESALPRSRRPVFSSKATMSVNVPPMSAARRVRGEDCCEDRRPAGRSFFNVCRHKGAMLCAAEEGNAKYHVCPYHGWAYDASGKNVDIKDRKTGSYPPSFDAEDHNLVPLAKVASYRGFVFGSLSAEVPPLEDFLGDMRFFIDIVADQGPNGLEFIPGRCVYTYRGNWKVQLDNGLDPYHLTTTHLSYMHLQARRPGGEGHLEARPYDGAQRNSADGGTFALAHGHAATWLEQPEPEKRPIYPA